MMIDKTVRIGRCRETADGGRTFHTYCKIKFDGARLSITGVEGPKANGDAIGSCGQIDMHDWHVSEYGPGWDAERVAMFRRLWSSWHLNDMRAGSPAQRAHLQELEAVEAAPRGDHYGWACARLEAAGLHPDPAYLGKDGAPYRYGREWLFEAVPEWVLQFLAALPETDITPAWV